MVDAHGKEPATHIDSIIAGAQDNNADSDSRQNRHAADSEGLRQEEGTAETSKSPYLGGVSVGRFWLIYAGVLANSFMSLFDATLMASTHPVITSYFHASNSASWLSVAFLLTSTSFQPLFGRLSDTIGRKPPYIFTLTVFLLGTTWCAFAQSVVSFILARAVCGLGAGGLMSMSSIIASDLLPIEIRGAYQSYVHIAFGAGSALGAATGGAIADQLGWRWEFGIQIPIIATVLTSACIFTPRDLGLGAGVTKDSFWVAIRAFDYRGSLLLTGSVTFLILGLNLGGNIFPWNHPIVLSAFAACAVCLPFFIYSQLRVRLPVIPLRLFSRNPCAGLITANFVGSVITNLILFNAPLYYQAVLLESATTSGLRLLVPSLCTSFIGVLTGFLITWSKKLKWSLNIGGLFLLAGTLCLTLMRRGLAEWTYSLFLVLPSMGQGFQNPGTFMSILSVSDQKDQAVVSSTLILFRSLGMVFGVACSSLVVQNALVYYLNKYVSGSEKDQIILEVRKSVQAIVSLSPEYKEQVINAYTQALMVTFKSAVVLAAGMLMIIFFIRLPRLGKKA